MHITVGPIHGHGRRDFRCNTVMCVAPVFVVSWWLVSCYEQTLSFVFIVHVTLFMFSLQMEQFLYHGWMNKHVNPHSHTLLFTNIIQCGKSVTDSVRLSIVQPHLQLCCHSWPLYKGISVRHVLESGIVWNFQVCCTISRGPGTWRSTWEVSG